MPELKVCNYLKDLDSKSDGICQRSSFAVDFLDRKTCLLCGNYGRRHSAPTAMSWQLDLAHKCYSHVMCRWCTPTMPTRLPTPSRRFPGTNLCVEASGASQGSARLTLVGSVRMGLCAPWSCCASLPRAPHRWAMLLCLLGQIF